MLIKQSLVFCWWWWLVNVFPHLTTGQNSVDGFSNQTLYNYDDIINEMNQATVEFLESAIETYNLIRDPTIMDQGDKWINQARRKKRSLDSSDHYLPEFIRNGINLISNVIRLDQNLCSTDGVVVDVSTVALKTQKYIICLVQTRDGQAKLLYGPAGEMKQSIPINIVKPRKMLAFVSEKAHESRFIQNLLIVVFSDSPKQNVKWFKISTGNSIEHQGSIDLFQVRPSQTAFWKRKDIVIMFDEERGLEMYRFTGTYFDRIEKRNRENRYSKSEVTRDLRSLCTFTSNGVFYLVLGYIRVMDSGGRPKDVTVFRYKENEDYPLENAQTIQTAEGVTDIQYFTIGRRGPQQENFLAIVERNNIIFYKFLKSKQEFIVFQRIKAENVRSIRTFADSGALFVLSVVLESNDLFFISYNSLRFIYSTVNVKKYLLAYQPVYFDRILNEKSKVQMLIGGKGGVQVYNVTFYHDENLLKLWTDQLEWCKQKRAEVGGLERRTTIVEDRFSTSFLKNDPLLIRGYLNVPAYSGMVETADYRQTAEPSIRINVDYFHEMSRMEQQLSVIEQELADGQHQLTDALLIDSNELQVINGNYTMHSVDVMEYRGNRFDTSHHHHPVHYPLTLNLITNNLNGEDVEFLFHETVAINGRVKISMLNQMYIDTIESATARLNGLVNEKFNMSDLVAASVEHHIPALKRFHYRLIVDESITASVVNGLHFARDKILLTTGLQHISNHVQCLDSIDANTLKVNVVNKVDIGKFFADSVRKNQPVQIKAPVVFDASLEVYDLLLDDSGRLNKHNMARLMQEVLWLNPATNQTITGDYSFEEDVSIGGNLFVTYMNGKNIPADLVLANEPGIIKGTKTFTDRMEIGHLNCTTLMNGLPITNAIPDILIKHIPQIITGKKIVPGLYIRANSSVGGLLNGLSIAQLFEQSRHRPTLQHYDRLYIENFANFEGGLHFDQLNSLTTNQLDALMHHSLTLTEQWTELQLNQVLFDDVRVAILDCDLINGLRLENDLLTLNTNQTILGEYSLGTVHLAAADSYIHSVNNYSINNLAAILLTAGHQSVTGTKVFQGDVYVHSLHSGIINDIPLADVVFEDEATPKSITAVKTFKASQLSFENLIVDHLNVQSVNRVNIDRMLSGSLLKSAFQELPEHIQFNTLWSEGGENFATPFLNRISLDQLQEDVVLANTASGLQNVTAAKVFAGDVRFKEVKFNRLFDGVTDWEMSHNWLRQNVTQNVQANFSMDHLAVGSVWIHDGRINGIDLGWLHENGIWLDRNRTIWTKLEFEGDTSIQGPIQSSFKMNRMNIENDLIHNTNPSANVMQTFKGKMIIKGNLTIMQQLDLHGSLNGIQIHRMCSQIYRPMANRSLMVRGNVRVLAPMRVNSINGIPLQELNNRALRHGIPNQRVSGKKIIQRLILNGPSTLRQYMNDVNLNYIFENYMSLTRHQDVDANIVLQNTILDGDAIVDRDMLLDSGVISGLDIERYHSQVLRIYGDQQYEGNINFVSDVNLDLGLNAHWINGFSSVKLMNKKQTNNFQEEISFSQNLNVANNVNIVSGRRIAGVDMNSLVKYAVLKHTGQNYTIHGTKTFDAIEVFKIHTKPLNNVRFSRENLLLKDYDQVVDGEKHFNGDVVANSSIILTTINQVPVNELNQRMVKRTAKNNLIRSKIRVRDLNVNTVSVNGLIDNIDITVLNQISNRVATMKNLQREVKNAKSKFELFEQNLYQISPKLLFYEHRGSVLADDPIGALSKPLFVCELHSRILVFLSGTSRSSQCNSINVYSVFPTNTSSIVPRFAFTLFVAGQVASIDQLHNQFLISSHFEQFETGEKLHQCISRNKPSHQSPSYVSLAKDGVLFQAFDFYIQSTPASAILSRFELFAHRISKPNVNLIWNNPTLVSLAYADVFQIVHLNFSNPKPAQKIPVTLNFEAKIVKVYNRQTLLLVLTVQEEVNSFQLHVHRFQVGNLTRIQTIPLFGSVKAVAVIHFPEFILVAEDDALRSVVSVYTNFGQNRFYKIQEIEQPNVDQIEVLDGTTTAEFLLRTDRSILLYRYSGLQGFRPHSEIHLLRPYRAMFVSNPTAQHTLVLYTGNCEGDGRLDFLLPLYRQSLAYGNQVSLNETLLAHNLTLAQ